MAWQTVAAGTLRDITDAKFTDFIQSDLTWPHVVMTGDAHRTPCLRWTEACPMLRDYFVSRMNAGMLYAYVEVRPAAVAAALLPGFLAPLAAQGRITGWEEPLFELLQPSMDAALVMMAADFVAGNAASVLAFRQQLGALDGLLVQVPEILRQGRVISGAIYTQISDLMAAIAAFDRKDGATAANATTLSQRANAYFNAAMGLRCSAEYHAAVGARIQTSILQAPAATHLIAAGDTHLTCATPLQNYINLDGAHALGWVDASQH